MSPYTFRRPQSSEQRWEPAPTKETKKEKRQYAKENRANFLLRSPIWLWAAIHEMARPIATGEPYWLRWTKARYHILRYPGPGPSSLKSTLDITG
jgi:hypothetical protein